MNGRDSKGYSKVIYKAVKSPAAQQEHNYTAPSVRFRKNEKTKIKKMHENQIKRKITNRHGHGNLVTIDVSENQVAHSGKVLKI